MKKNINLDNIVETIPKNLTDIEKTRYLYLELCRKFIFDQRFATKDPVQMDRIFNKEFDFNNIDDNKAVCSMLSKMYIYLLEKVGIKASAIYLPNNLVGHVSVVMQIEDNGKKDYYYVSITDDLMNVKQGYKTKGFCCKPPKRPYITFEGFSSLPEANLQQIDCKLGYTYNVQEKYIYLNDAVEILSKEMRDINIMRQHIKNRENIKGFIPDSDILKYKIEFIVNYINSFCKNLSGIEKKDFLFELVKSCLTEDEYKIFGKYNCNDNNKRILTILKVKGQIKEDDIFYLIQDTGNILKIDQSKVQKLFENGVKPFWTHVQIISENRPFDEVNKEFNTKLSIYSQKYPEKACAAILLQSCNRYIALYKNYTCKEFKKGSKNFFTKKMYQELDYFLKIFEEYQKYSEKVPKEIYKQLENRLKKIDIKNNNIEELYNIICEIQYSLFYQANYIIELTEEYKKALSECAEQKDILLTHVSPEAKAKMIKRAILPHYERTQYGTEFGKFVFASSEDNKNNAYVISMANNSQMRLLPNTYEIPMYLLGADNLSITNGKVISKERGYIYYITPNGFIPEVELKANQDYNTVSFVFGNEWRYEGVVSLNVENNFPNVVKIGTYNDITEILKYNQIFTQLKKLSPQEIELLSNPETCNDTLKKLIADGKIRDINTACGINPFHSNKITDKTVVISAEEAIDANCRTTNDICQAKENLLGKIKEIE